MISNLCYLSHDQYHGRSGTHHHPRGYLCGHGSWDLCMLQKIKRSNSDLSTLSLCCIRSTLLLQLPRTEHCSISAVGRHTVRPIPLHRTPYILCTYHVHMQRQAESAIPSNWHVRISTAVSDASHRPPLQEVMAKFPPTHSTSYGPSMESTVLCYCKWVVFIPARNQLPHKHRDTHCMYNPPHCLVLLLG